MLKKIGNKITFLFSCMTIVVLFTSGAFAACSPGIPCTDYDIYTNTTSGTDAALNGPKTATPSPHINDTGSTTSACDGNFMNQIYSHAFMEASREVIMSEQIINKPDSVLEYTCFDQWVSVTGKQAAQTFSESTFWENHEICTSTGDSTASAGRPPSCASGGSNTVSPYSVTINVSYLPDTLSTDLVALIYGNLQTYIDNNFDHTFMGEATTIDNNLATVSIGSGSYNCSHMSTVWNIAKCIDFMEDDRFRTFEDLVLKDPRSIPVECSVGNSSNDTVTAGSNSTKIDNTVSGSSTSPLSVMDPCPAAGTVTGGVNTDFSNDLIRVSNNCDKSANLNAYSSFDVMELYGDLFLGVLAIPGIYIPGTGGVPGVVICSSPIPTGVPVVTYAYDNLSTGPGALLIVTKTPKLHYEHICPNPGCYYRPIKVPFVINLPLPPPTTIPTGLCLPY